MKKLLVILLFVTVLLTLVVSCGKSAPATTHETTTAAVTTNTTPTSITATVTTGTKTPVITTTAPETKPPVPTNESFILNDILENYVNEDVHLGTQDKMIFSSHWGLSQNYHTRFVGGDEHWVALSRVGSAESATCTITFFGHAIEVYGHTCPAGGMVSVTLDGEVLDETPDFYSAKRTEALTGKYSGTLLPFVKLEGLENKEHTLIITLIDKTNPKQSGDNEIAIDYAVVTRLTGSNPTAGADIPSIDTAVEGYIGNAQEYLYTSDYNKIYDKLATNPPKSASLTLFQNDLVNSRIDLVIGGSNIVLTATASDFVGNNDAVLPKEFIQLSFLEAVRDHETNKKVFDVLGDSAKYFGAKTCGALWVAVSTDETIPAGVYQGTITISADCCERNFPYTIEVVGMDISKADATLTNELWMYPYSACRYYSGKTVLEYFGTDHTVSDKTSLRDIYLDDAYMDQLAAQIRLYAQAGGDIITTTITEDAWNNQTTDPYPSMIKWTRAKDGSWKFDYTDFDKWVALNIANGVDGKIRCYSIAAWNTKIIYFNESTGKNASIIATPKSATWQKLWTAFITDFMKHVKEKGWFDITYLSMDERSTEEIAAVVELVNSIKDENGKSFKMSMAVNRTHSIDYFDYFEDLSISSSQRNNLGNLVADRAAKGLSTTFYTCGATAGSLRNQPYETVDFFYFLYKKGCDGYLRWAFDAFPDEPLKDTLHWKFVAGDENLIYPDLIEENATVRSSVRYQIMIESYKNIAALETLSSYSAEGANKVKKIIGQFAGYSSNMQTQASAVEKGVITFAKQLLNK
ncbi:MAG: DUF4091 domain-containing protein [Clostridia bacterium]|nr:DUF4091 domain-containing protein [Clostridia bacterium]